MQWARNDKRRREAGHGTGEAPGKAHLDEYEIHRRLCKALEGHMLHSSWRREGHLEECPCRPLGRRSWQRDTCPGVDILVCGLIKLGSRIRGSAAPRCCTSAPDRVHVIAHSVASREACICTAGQESMEPGALEWGSRWCTEAHKVAGMLLWSARAAGIEAHASSRTARHK